jgi:hypothetical protein
VAALWVVGFFNPLRWTSEEGLRSWLLESTPLGISKSRVQAFVDSKAWENAPGRKDDDLFVFGKYLRKGRSGDSAICAHLGSYQGLGIWFWEVGAMWVFDEQGKLVDIEVHKQFVGP